MTIVLVTYTAGIVNNLFWASMMHGRDPLRHEIHNLEELVQGTDHHYDYGTIRDGSTERYLQKVAKGGGFRMMRKYLSSENGQAQMVDSIEEGIEKVRKGKYAFILESMTAKYESNRLPCDLMTLGQTFGLRGFGLAIPKSSPIIDDLHSGVLEMIENGDIEQLEERWFTGEDQCWNVTKVEQSLSREAGIQVNKPKQINMTIFWGPLVMMISGLVISVLVTLAEVLWYKYRGRVSTVTKATGAGLVLMYVVKLQGQGWYSGMW